MSENERGHSNDACCSCCYEVNAEAARADRLAEALEGSEQAREAGIRKLATVQAELATARTQLRWFIERLDERNAELELARTQLQAARDAQAMQAAMLRALPEWCGECGGLQEGRAALAATDTPTEQVPRDSERFGGWISPMPDPYTRADTPTEPKEKP
jgi:chromosome segregation ATPase